MARSSRGERAARRRLRTGTRTRTRTLTLVLTLTLTLILTLPRLVTLVFVWSRMRVVDEVKRRVRLTNHHCAPCPPLTPNPNPNPGQSACAACA